MEQATKHMIFVSIFVILFNIASHKALSQPLSNSTKHFVLVHGSGHGAWCWYRLVPLLRSSGHTVTAIDLAASGIDPQQINDLRSISDYIKPLRDLLASLPPNEKVILVGHSLGGLALSQTMERLPSKISAAVFLTALMPGPSLTISTLNQELGRRQHNLSDTHFTFGNGPNNSATSYTFGPKDLLLKLYQLSPIEDWTLATTLIRETRQFTEQELSRDLVLTRENYGSVKRVFMIAEKDLILEKDFQRWMIQKNPPNEVKEILGSDHMAMLSASKELWGFLLQISEKYN
ncbi:ESTERASE PIR7A-RELATED [Salix koriyanagi]|uniref:(S)-hydroxynitrile lyase n=2 Tax=Salix TaxID=40685 RepID=A0A9Q0ZLS2_9ROSI|nr:ESTERASE PIR7A-RELATED [Salix koriyanagi]